ncbi:MAG: tyrosine-type recombinase/integrase [bacterium]|nr:tyrosine-type recombinase/integrase [bacterium]
MGSFVRKRGEAYWTDFTVRRRRTRVRIGKVTKGYAEKFATELRAKMLLGHGIPGESKPTEISLSGLMERSLQVSSSNNASRTLEREGHALRTFINKTGIKKVSEITPLLIEDYKTHRLKEVSARTVNIEVGAVKTMLNRAVQLDLMPTNPIASVKKIKGPSWKPIQFLTKEQVSALLENSSPTYRPIFYTYLNTGMRREELVNLEWSDIDWQNKQIRIINKEKKRYHPKGQKERFIPIKDDLMAILKEQKRKANGSYVFGTTNGEPRHNNILRELKRAAKRAGIEHITIHMLRHTFASHLVMAGVDLPTVQKLLGHSSITTTMIYAHLSPGHLRSAIEKINLS